MVTKKKAVSVRFVDTSLDYIELTAKKEPKK